jgi:phosphoheptose isomerase
MEHLDFENFEQRFKKTLETEEYKKFLKMFNESDEVYVVANGGLWAVGNHAADDCNRLFAKAGVKKMVYTMESQCMMTSIANDYGYNNMFVKWLELFHSTGKMSKDALVIGLSCSGTSKNVISSLYWAQENGYKTAMIDGQKSDVLPNGVHELSFDTEYFHTTEILTLVLFYELIHACGAQCPTIRAEKMRKSVSQPLSRPIKGKDDK